MARTNLKPGPIVPGPELRSFARLAGPMFSEPAARQGGTRSQRGRRGAGLQYLDHREYVPGDDLRWVSWPLTARLGRPMVRQFQREAATDWMVCVDGSSSMVAVGGEKWLRARQMAVAVAYTLLDLGHRAGLIIYGPGIAAICPPGRGQSQFTAIDRALQRHTPGPRGVVAALGNCLGQLRGASAAFIVSDFLCDEPAERDLGLLRRACAAVHALQVYSPAELRLPVAGPAELVDLETGARRPCVSSPALELRATSHALALAQRLTGFCTGHGIAFSRTDTSQTWRQALLRHLAGAAAG